MPPSATHHSRNRERVLLRVRVAREQHPLSQRLGEFGALATRTQEVGRNPSPTGTAPGWREPRTRALSPPTRPSTHRQGTESPRATRSRRRAAHPSRPHTWHSRPPTHLRAQTTPLDWRGLSGTVLEPTRHSWTVPTASSHARPCATGPFNRRATEARGSRPPSQSGPRDPLTTRGRFSQRHAPSGKRRLSVVPLPHRARREPLVEADSRATPARDGRTGAPNPCGKESGSTATPQAAAGSDRHDALPRRFPAGPTRRTPAEMGRRHRASVGPSTRRGQPVPPPLPAADGSPRLGSCTRRPPPGPSPRTELKSVPQAPRPRSRS
jgi:hypothetical protein